MSLHESIVADLDRLVDDADADIITPTSLALALQHRYSTGRVDPRIEYTSLEHLKQMARDRLRRRHDPDGEENEAHQGELFSGHLQERYPLPRKRGDEPAYKRREALTDEEIDWNIAMLDRSAHARLMHRDALTAWKQSRAVAAE